MSATCYIQIKICDLCFSLQLLKIAMKPKSPSQRQFYTQFLNFTLEPLLPSAIVLCVYTVYMSVWSALQFSQILALKSTLNCKSVTVWVCERLLFMTSHSRLTLSVGLLKPQIRLQSRHASVRAYNDSKHIFFNGNFEYAFCSPAAVIFFFHELSDVLSHPSIHTGGSSQSAVKLLWTFGLGLLGKLLR